MKPTFKLLSFTVFLIITTLFSCIFSCGVPQSRQIKIENKYLGDVDSLLVYINSITPIKMTQLKPEFDTTLDYSKVKLIGGKNLLIAASLFMEGKKVDSFMTYDDLGYLPVKTQLTISNNLKIVITYPD